MQGLSQHFYIIRDKQLQKYTASYLFTIYMYIKMKFPTIQHNCIDLFSETNVCVQFVNAKPFQPCTYYYLFFFFHSLLQKSLH